MEHNRKTITLHYQNMLSVFPPQLREHYRFSELELPTRHNILVDEPHIQSLAALKKLDAHYRAMGASNTQRIHKSHRLRNAKKTFVDKMEKLGPLKCFYCGHKLERLSGTGQDRRKRWSVTVDHFIPVSRSILLAFDHSNMRLACGQCNSEKSSKIMVDMPYDLVYNTPS